MKTLLTGTRRLVVGVLAVLLVLGLALDLSIRSFVTPGRLVEAVENELDARVEVGELAVRVWGMPSQIVLRGLKLAPRDRWTGTPPGERPPLKGAPVEIRELRLAVALPGLLRRRIEVREFAFDGPRVEMTLLEDGGNSLEPLFRPPETRKRTEKRTEKRKRTGSGALNVHEVGILARLEGVAVRNGRARITVEKSGLVIAVEDWSMELDRIELDPGALESMNTARLRLGGSIVMDGKAGHRYGLLHVHGPAEVRLFDPRSGDFDPEVQAKLGLGEESYLTARIPVVDEAWRQVKRLANLGLDLGGFPERSTFGRSKALVADYQSGVLTIREPLSTWFGDWELAVLGGAWMRTAGGNHEASGELMASRRSSGLLGRQLGKAIGYLPQEVQAEVAREVETAWFREGRLVAELESSGDLSDPEVRVLNEFADLAGIVKEAAGEFAQEKLMDLGGALLERLLDEEEQ